MDLRIPKDWLPRDYQWPLWDYLDHGGKRALAIYHRRSGKDELALMWAARATQLRVGNYWHLLPESQQCRKAIWEAINPTTGKRRIDEAYPDEIVKRKLDNEMFIEFRNHSTWQVIGSDNYDHLIGASPAGLVFSEWSTSDPNAWTYLEPIVNENSGWALFITTPRGSDNHASKMYESRRDDPAWFAQVLSATDTGVFTPAQLEDARLNYIDIHGELVGDSYFRQEYLCSFTAPLQGSIYGYEIEKLEQSTPPQITDLAYDRKYPVHTVWDIGGTTAIIFFQTIGQKIHIIDYLESTGLDASWYVGELQKKEYVYQHHLFPADLEEADDWSNPRSRIDTLRSLHIRPRVLPKQKSIQDGINSVLQVLPHCWFDRTRCKKLLIALKQYHRTWDADRKVFSTKAYKDWTSHGADALRYLAISGVKNSVKRDLPKPRMAIV